MSKSSDVNKMMGFLFKILSKKELLHELLDAVTVKYIGEEKNIGEGKIVLSSHLINETFKEIIIKSIKDLVDYDLKFFKDQIGLDINLKRWGRMIDLVCSIKIDRFMFNAESHMIMMKYFIKDGHINMLGGKLISKFAIKYQKKMIAIFLLNPISGVGFKEDTIVVDLDHIDALQELIKNQPYINALYHQIEINGVQVRKNEIVFAFKYA